MSQTKNQFFNRQNNINNLPENGTSEKFEWKILYLIKNRNRLWSTRRQIKYNLTGLTLILIVQFHFT